MIYIKWFILILSIITIIFLIYQSKGLYRKFIKEITMGLERTQKLDKLVISERDIAHLPIAVQNYLKYVGVIGK